MNAKQSVAYNGLWNISFTVTQLLVGFLITPFLVTHLGNSTYGLWVVISTLTTYFGTLDLGITSSVGRNVAFFRARNDIAGVNGVLNTAFFYLCGVAVLSLFATLGALFLFFVVIDVAPDQVDEARFALLLVGLNFALTLPLNAFDGILWAYQRFDLQNKVDIPNLLGRAGLTYWFIGSGYGLVTLALITLLSGFAGLLVKAILAFRMEPGLRVGLPMVTRQSATGLFSYGIWLFPTNLIKSLAPQVIITIIGSRFGTSAVTPLSIAQKLVGYANNFLLASTSVLTPIATGMHARNEHDRQRDLLIMGARGCLGIALLFASLFVFLGEPLIHLWIRTSDDFAYPVYPMLLILIAGEVLPMSQQITSSIILGKGNIRILTYNSAWEIGISTLLLLLLLGDYGMAGACFAVAFPAAIFRGVSPMIYACKAVGLPVAMYIGRAMLPTVVAAAGPALLLGLVTRWWTPGTWVELFICGGAYAMLYGGVVGISLFGIQVWRDLARRMIGRSQDEKNGPELVDAAVK